MSTKKPSFEENMMRLEQIVRAMERGDVPLEDSMKLFEEGTAIVKCCSQMLDSAQQKITKISMSSDGSPAEEAFADGSDI